MLGRKLILLFVSSGISVGILVLSYRAIFPGVAVDNLPSPQAIFSRRQMMQDPVLGLRMQPGVRGLDSNGFRNKSVPNQVDVLAVGDSLTWGFNAIPSQNWPSRYQQLCHCSIYNVGMGGFGPAQYYFLARRFLKELHPGRVIVALYLGNDLVDAYQQTYQADYFRQFRKAGMVYSDRIIQQSKQTKERDIEIRYGSAKTALTPDSRLIAVNLANEEVVEGWRLTEVYISEIQRLCTEAHAKLIVAILPTKESVYRGVSTDPMVSQQISLEDAIRNKLKLFFQANRVAYVDALSAMMANRGQQLYLENRDAHPAGLGYEVIGEAIYENSKKIDAVDSGKP